MNAKISIIVPVYNAEQYIDDCLNSLFSQTYKNYEVIVVDDGSTDKSFDIISRWTIKDCRFCVFQKKNGGVSSARNEGLRHATGDYVCFVDADDQVVSTYLADLFRAIGNKVDSAMGGFKKIDLLSHVDCEIVPPQKIETLEDNLIEFYAAGQTDWQRYVWNRMFKNSIIQENKLSFKENIYYKEDGLFVVQYLCSSNGLVGCVDKVLYHYYRNTSGAMSKTWHSFDEKLLTNLEAHKLIIKLLKRRKVSIDILSIAKEQAKLSCNWIILLMMELKCYKLPFIVRIEKNYAIYPRS